MRLTETSTFGGCAAKMGARQLFSLLEMHRKDAPSFVQIGVREGDDAAVISLSNGLQIVQTVDMIPPPVDDPYDFGQIAAANAVSDIYAMGGIPLTALIIASLSTEIADEVYGTVFLGCTEKLSEAGAFVVGGHTILDPTVKIGVSVLGYLEQPPLTVADAVPGDSIYLTKPLGTGLYINGLKSGRLTSGDAEDAVTSMKSLNSRAAMDARAAGARAATDITGFGLIGHLLNIAQKSNVSIEVFTGELPVFQHAEQLVSENLITSGSKRNRDSCQGSFASIGHVPHWVEEICFDPQTSGGLAICSQQPINGYAKIGRVLNGSPLITLHG